MRVTTLLVFPSLLFAGGCVVHDRSGAPEPIWWPTAVVRESTLAPTNGRIEIGLVDPVLPLLPPFSADAPAGRAAVHPFIPRSQ